MKNIAYKTIKNNPNLPDGFIIDHLETDEDAVEGYSVTSKEAFSQLLANNIELLRQHESRKGIEVVHPNQPPFPRRANKEAEPVDAAMMAERKKAIEKAREARAEELALFKQFLAWKASQGSDS